MTPLRLMPLSTPANRQNEFSLVYARLLDADRFARAMKHPHELPYGPPVLVPIAKLVRRSTRKGHVKRLGEYRVSLVIRFVLRARQYRRDPFRQSLGCVPRSACLVGSGQLNVHI